MKKAILALALISTAIGGIALARIPFFDTEHAKESLTSRLENDDKINLATEAYDAMMAKAVKELKATGHTHEANQLESDWHATYKGMLRGLVTDMGDHKPFSEWIAKTYKMLEDIFGEPYMELTHLRDIWVMDFAITVVFHPQAASPWCPEEMKLHPQDNCETEYRRHFAGTKFTPDDPYATDIEHHGFAGVVAYWVTFAACEAATYGAGTAIVCTPAATVVEYAIEYFVAPGISNKIYERYNG